MITLDLSILNQKGTPMFFSDLTANRPAAGIVGRIFIATDSPFGIFRDTGSAWDQVAGSGGGGGNTIYTANDTLTSNRTISSGGFTLTFAPQTTFLSSLTAATNASRYSALGQNTLSYAAGFSSSNLGLTYGAIGGINLQTFDGSATFAQSNIAAANISVNSIDFSSVSSTIQMTQASGIRAMAGHINQFQYQGTNSGTISHAAVSQNLGFYRPSGATGTLTITNAYGFLLNDLNDYGSGFTFTNSRWGIYQAGASDNNYFAATSFFGTQNIPTIYGSAVFSKGGLANRVYVNHLNNTGVTYSINNIPKFTASVFDPFGAGNYKFILFNDTIGGVAGECFMIPQTTNNFIIGSQADSGEKFQLTGSIRVNNQRSATAGGASGQHLIINCDGTTYKIALLNP